MSGAALTEEEARWPATQVELRPVAEIAPYGKNVRTHPASQIEDLANAIRQWGFTIPVLIDEAGVLIAGHARVQAAQKLGLARVPTIVARGWSESQRRAYVIADNRLAQLSSWDSANLREELSLLGASDFDVQLLGFSDRELAKLCTTDAAALVPKSAPETSAPIKCPSCGHEFAPSEVSHGTVVPAGPAA